ncbi:GNAT family N-acetyltransferase [Azohydromonas caseinilytica]|uniref:GNAT family N-acetyltransferase n=1 Tax=Azohydromonas caseinilytica TaxID=2728836 RepID=A0A848FEZ2_9BURK|nr:GNAT family N-acetyltransferase [Azohydromonas caseinilytica]NML17405.1 GNAT family N-acetyltransferase [Azohydromonas caseinilytica]
MINSNIHPPHCDTTVRTGSWQQLGSAAQAIRQAVFVEEQGIPAQLERDPADTGCLHAVAFDAAGQAVGTGRLLPLPDGVMKLGRLAVLRSQRGQGVGQVLLQALLDAAHAQGAREVMLHAQQSAASFYLPAGFTVRGDEFIEAGLPHVEMVLVLDQDQS